MARADLSKQASDVATMFDQVAKGYDRTNAVLSLGNDALWRIATVRAVSPRAGELILDLAAGTGTSSVTFAKSGATVTAADFSAGMIEVGRQRHPSIGFVQADATALPFTTDQFDVVTISFGLRNVEEPKKALTEMYRVLKPGGRIVICEFSRPPRALFRAGYGAYMKYAMPWIVRLASSNSEAYDYLADSIREWPDQDTLSQWLRGAGFTRVAHRNLTFGVVALHRGRKPASVPRTRRSRRVTSGTIAGSAAPGSPATGAAPRSPAPGSAPSPAPSGG